MPAGGRTVLAVVISMPDTRHYPIVPADQTIEDEPLERRRVARWIPIAVPLLAVLLLLVLAIILGATL